LKRDSVRIVRDILDSAVSGRTKTEIVYRARINFKLFDKYVPLLVKRNLLKVISRDSYQVYITTEKGLALLKKINEVLNAIFG